MWRCWSSRLLDLGGSGTTGYNLATRLERRQPGQPESSANAPHTCPGRALHQPANLESARSSCTNRPPPVLSPVTLTTRRGPGTTLVPRSSAPRTTVASGVPVFQHTQKGETKDMDSRSWAANIRSEGTELVRF